jgi:hypothetical protein
MTAWPAFPPWAGWYASSAITSYAMARATCAWQSRTPARRTIAWRRAGPSPWTSTRSACARCASSSASGFAQPHGYTFLVPVSGNGPALPVALKDMGRFAKEAALADDHLGIVYQTDDAGNSSGFYRFVPSDPPDLVQGGRLQMLRVAGQPAFTGWSGQTVGRSLSCGWADIANPDPELAAGAPSCFAKAARSTAPRSTVSKASTAGKAGRFTSSRQAGARRRAANCGISPRSVRTAARSR